MKTRDAPPEKGRGKDAESDKKNDRPLGRFKEAAAKVMQIDPDDVRALERKKNKP